MKRLHWFLLFFFLSLSLSGQRSADFGVFAGVSSYFGDINPNRLLYSPLPAGGIFYRYNLNPREALRANLFVGGIRGNDHDFNIAFQQARGASFSDIVGDLALQFEFNFLPYSTEGKRWNFTPYFAGGAGMAVLNGSSIKFLPVIPFSFGFKVNV